MKNKFITICVILAVLLSFASFAALMVQFRSTDVDEPSDSVTDVSETVTFMWDGEEYTVKKGTTFKEFVETETSLNATTLKDGYIYVDYKEYTGYLDIDINGEIQNGQGYGDIYYYFFIEGKEFSFHNGATWESYINCPNRDIEGDEFSTEYPDVSMDSTCIYLGTRTLSHYEYEGHMNDGNVLGKDLIIERYNYLALK